MRHLEGIFTNVIEHLLQSLLLSALFLRLINNFYTCMCACIRVHVRVCEWVVVSIDVFARYLSNILFFRNQY